MCLNWIEHRWSPANKLDAPEIGYKVFFKIKDCYHPFVMPNHYGSYKMNEWCEDDNENILFMQGSEQTYPIGFHIFKNYMDAYFFRNQTMKGIICKVLYNDVVAIGEQGTNRMTIVARKFKIIEEID